MPSTIERHVVGATSRRGNSIQEVSTGSMGLLQAEWFDVCMQEALAVAPPLWSQKRRVCGWR